ncbi:MAG: DUF5320 family protein [Bacillota bacterium]
MPRGQGQGYCRRYSENQPENQNAMCRRHPSLPRRWRALGISRDVVQPAKAEESEKVSLLRKEADFLRQQLGVIEKRLQGLEKGLER